MAPKAQKKIPVRRCVGCGEGRPKKELVRVVRTPEGVVSLDLTGRKAGRGAYLCPRSECLKRAVKRKSLQRALETEIPAGVLEAMQAEIEQAEEETEEADGG